MTTEIDSDDEPVLDKIADQIEIDFIEPILDSTNQPITDDSVDLIETVKTEIIEDDFVLDLVESGVPIEVGDSQEELLTVVKQEVVMEDDPTEEIEMEDFNEPQEDQLLTDEELYKKYGITPLPNQNPNPLKTGTTAEKYSCQVCDKRFKLKKTWLYHLNSHANGSITSSGERVKKRKSVPAAPPSASRKYMKILRQNTKSGFTKTRCSFCLRQIKIIPLTNHTRRKRVDLRNIQVLGSEVNSITDVEEVWTVLHHQLKHCAYTKPPRFMCNHCNWDSSSPTPPPSNRDVMNKHLRDRLCFNADDQRDKRIDELYALCEKQEQSRRIHFRCFKCDWTKTSRSIESLRSHLGTHVDEEIKFPDHCQYYNYDGGYPCNKSRHDLAFEYGLPRLASDTVQRKSIDAFLDVHLVQHMVDDIGKMVLENITFFKKIQYYYQCTVCWIRFFKDFDSLKLHGREHNQLKLVYRDIRKIDLAQEAAVLQKDSAYFEKVILRGTRFTHLKGYPPQIGFRQIPPKPSFTPFAGKIEKSIHSCTVCGGEFLDQDQMSKHHCTQIVPAKLQKRPRPGPRLSGPKLTH